jgi:hypothetical protein
LKTLGFLNKERCLVAGFAVKAQSRVLFVEMISFPCLEGAGHREIKFNVTMRCMPTRKAVGRMNF